MSAAREAARAAKKAVAMQEMLRRHEELKLEKRAVDRVT